jgi:hypothetical protein
VSASTLARSCRRLPAWSTARRAGDFDRIVELRRAGARIRAQIDLDLIAVERLRPDGLVRAVGRDRRPAASGVEQPEPPAAALMFTSRSCPVVLWMIAAMSALSPATKKRGSTGRTSRALVATISAFDWPTSVSSVIARARP